MRLSIVNGFVHDSNAKLAIVRVNAIRIMHMANLLFDAITTSLVMFSLNGYEFAVNFEIKTTTIMYCRRIH